jgi:Tol biopolymer transport system component
VIPPRSGGAFLLLCGGDVLRGAEERRSSSGHHAERDDYYHRPHGGILVRVQNTSRGELPVNKRVLAVLGTGSILVGAVLWSRDEKPADNPPAVKLPKALGAIHPRISPDGLTVAVSYQGEIWTGPRTGGTLTLLTPSEGVDTEPTWAPDGKRIAFIRGATVRVVDFPDGKEVPLPKPLLTANVYSVNKLDFSADGNALFGAFRIGNENSLAWYDLATGALTPLMPIPTVSYNFRFVFSPDGKSVVYTAMPDVPGEQSGSDGSHTDLWKRAADGSGKPEKLSQ